MSYLDLLGSLFEGNRKNVAAAGTFTNSPLVDYTRISPNKTVNRSHVIDTITIHCYVGQVSVENAGAWFAKTTTAASCNYVIGSDGRIGLIVEEKDRSWCSSNKENDHRAITIECASDKTHPYAVNAAVYESLIDLCADICKRNGIKQLLWKGDKSLIGQIQLQNMTVHRWFKNKACPGDYLYSRHSEIAAKVNAILNPSPGQQVQSSGFMYCVQTGAFSKEQNAKNMAGTLKAKGFDTYITKQDGFWKVQVGAYSKKMNATNMQTKLKAAGYDSIIAIKQSDRPSVQGGSTATVTPAPAPVVTPTPTPAPAPAPAPKKTAQEVAQEIAKGIGNWGVGGTRKAKLEAQGYNYREVQDMVNAIIKGQKASGTTTTATKPTKKAGLAVKLSSTPLYTSSTAKNAIAKKSGTYYLWDTKVLNGRIRITNRASNAGNASQVTGWVRTSDIGL